MAEGAKLRSRAAWQTGLLRLIATEWLVLLPAVTLIAYWLGGEGWLISLAIGAPVLWVTITIGLRMWQAPSSGGAPMGLASDKHLIAMFDEIAGARAVSGRTTACFVVMQDDVETLIDRHGRLAHDAVVAKLAERLSLVLREGDVVARLPEGGFGIGLGSMRRFDLETAVQLAARLQAACVAPMALGELTVYPSVCVGFCLLERASAPTGAALMDAARIAADEAMRNGPGAIRAFTPDMSRHRADRAQLRAGLEQALDEGQIRPWFQPQLCTDTGTISGFEALARWHHPERGIISPAEFLPLIDDSGLSERLCEVVLYGALSALNRWDKAGYRVPRVAVNFSAPELRNPKLVEKLKWELDRFSLPAERLTVEVLETVASKSDEDVIVTNLAALSQMGCGIDLDDFGTGTASMSNIRRFAVKRIKIDRSFVTRADVDSGQKRMVAAIVSMADHLGLSTVAEGVETPGEHATVAQLGCAHVQGFGIARPMAIEESFGWIERHEKGLSKTLRLGRSHG